MSEQATTTTIASNELWKNLDLPRDRPKPELPGALMAVAGALASIGAVVLAGDVLDDSRGLSVLVVVTMVLVGYGAIALVPQMRPAGIVLIATGGGALPAFLLFDPPTDDRSTAILALATLLWLGAWLAPLSQGRPLLLGLALGGAWLLLLDLAEGELDDPTSALGTDNGTYYLSLFVGVGYLAAAWAIDRRGKPGVATPFIVVGDLATVVGAFAVAGDLGDTGGSILVVAAGLVVGWVGHLGGRRLTTWLGAAVAGGGVVGLVGALIGDDADVNTIAMSLVGAGVVLALALLVVEQQRVARAARAASGPAAAAPSAPSAPSAPTAPFAPTAPSSEGGWYPDPTGRYAHRWWDGTRWTDQVADHDGRTGTDAGA